MQGYQLSLNIPQNLFPVGTRVLILAPHQYAGRTGRVSSRCVHGDRYWNAVSDLPNEYTSLCHCSVNIPGKTVMALPSELVKLG